jgi:glycosyltransferase involved in cell wall biosynthesis
MLRNMLNSLKRIFPKLFRVVFALRDWAMSLPIRLKLSAFQKSNLDIEVTYLSPHFPDPPVSRSELAHGGAVKLTYLAESFSHHFPAANLIYTVSSVDHPIQTDILLQAKQKGLKIVVNQNGVAFPAWDGENYKRTNALLHQKIQFADFIVYQSQFCKDSAERYITPPNVPSEIIYNPVDIDHFAPQDVKKSGDLTLLLGGNQYEKYRLELALQTLQSLLEFVPTARLIVTGNLWRPYHEAWSWTKQAVQDMRLTENIKFVGSYTQENAPTLYSNAHILLHTKYADPSPGLIPEALACGLPVVHLSNGGVPELVGDAGIGVPIEHDWNRINLPESQKMAEAVLRVYEGLNDYSQRARQQAGKFALKKFIENHTRIFSKVLEKTL